MKRFFFAMDFTEPEFNRKFGRVYGEDWNQAFTKLYNDHERLGAARIYGPHATTEALADDLYCTDNDC